MKGSPHLPKFACSWHVYWLLGGASLQLATPVAEGVPVGLLADGVIAAAGDGEDTGLAPGVGLGVLGVLKTSPF